MAAIISTVIEVFNSRVLHLMASRPVMQSDDHMQPHVKQICRQHGNLLYPLHDPDGNLNAKLRCPSAGACCMHGYIGNHLPRIPFIYW